MVRLLSLIVCWLFLIGADLPSTGYVFHMRGQSLYATHTDESLRQAVVEYTSAILENPRDADAVSDRALVYSDMGNYRLAIHDADTAMIYGNDESYYYVVGRSKPSIECLRRAYRLACLRGDRALIPAVGKLLLHYETRYLYVTEKEILP